jgi:hypothetical protein
MKTCFFLATSIVDLFFKVAAVRSSSLAQGAQAQLQLVFN